MARTTRRVFPDGDYADRLAESYSAALEAAEYEAKHGRGTLLEGELSDAERLAESHEALKKKAETDAKKKDRVVLLQAVGRSVWRQLKGAHPARLKGDDVTEDEVESDKFAGLNVDTVEDDLIHACLVEPPSMACARDQRSPNLACTEDNPCSNRAKFDEWIGDDLAPGEISTLARDSFNLVNVSKVDPKSLPPSQTRSNGGN